MMVRVGVEQPPDHTLVLRMVFPGLAFEELDASLIQSDGDFDPFIVKDEVFGAREKVRNDLEVPERFVGVLYFRAHRFASLSANNRLRKSE
jgi:hypothetical protein